MSVGRADPEILQDMLDKAGQKLASARTNLAAGQYDDAVSRAYYAVFHAVSAVLAQRGLAYSSHGQTLGAFNKEIVKAGALPPEAFAKLQRLFADRHTGDYDASKALDEETGRRDLADAEWLVEACRALIEAGEAE